jgi:type III restriction enzyme
MTILKCNKENILLEFTATIDLSNINIKEKYLDKIIYKYDLKEFRKD